MLNDENLLKFLLNSEKRISNLTRWAAELKVVEIYEAVEKLESVIQGSKAHFYGTRVMQLGHRRSHINIFLESGKFETKKLHTQTTLFYDYLQRIFSKT